MLVCSRMVRVNDGARAHVVELVSAESVADAQQTARRGRRCTVLVSVYVDLQVCVSPSCKIQVDTLSQASKIQEDTNRNSLSFPSSQLSTKRLIASIHLRLTIFYSNRYISRLHIDMLFQPHTQHTWSSPLKCDRSPTENVTTN